MGEWEARRGEERGSRRPAHRAERPGRRLRRWVALLATAALAFALALTGMAQASAPDGVVGPEGSSAGDRTEGARWPLVATDGARDFLARVSQLQAVDDDPNTITPFALAGLTVSLSVGASSTGPWEKTLSVPDSASVWWRIEVFNNTGVPMSDVWVSDSATNVMTLVPVIAENDSVVEIRAQAPPLSSTVATAVAVLGRGTPDEVQAQDTAELHALGSLSPNPSAEPSVSPSVTPSAIPSAEPSAPPSASPSAEPGVSPSASPSVTPGVPVSTSPDPVPVPSESPSGPPAPAPVLPSSGAPSASPTATPRSRATPTRRSTPTRRPSSRPSPSRRPSMGPWSGDRSSPNGYQGWNTPSTNRLPDAGGPAGWLAIVAGACVAGGVTLVRRGRQERTQ